MPSTYEERKSNTLSLLRQYRTLEKASLAEHEFIFSRKLELLIRHVRASGWWRSHLGPRAESEGQKFSMKSALSNFPTLTREILQNELNWMRIWIRRSVPEDYVELSTSGSTGQPVKIKQYSPIYQSHYAALELLDTQWSERNLNKNLGYFRITDPPAFERVIGEPFSYLGFSGKVFSKKFVGVHPREILEIIAQNSIRYVSLNAMAIRMLALEQLSRPVKGLSIEHFLSWADPVTSELRELVQESFKAKVIDRYSSNEFGFLAIQCPADEHLHSLQVNNFIEIVDSENQPLPVGETGRVLVTSLNNFSQPMIRYELGDLASWGEGCRAGITFPILQPGIVRQRDMHLDQEGRMRVPHPDGISAIKSGLVNRYQIFRFRDSIVLLGNLTRQATATELDEILMQLESQFSLGIRAKFFELPESLGHFLNPWKNKRVVVIDAPEPKEISAQVLIELMPKLGQAT